MQVLSLLLTLCLFHSLSCVQVYVDTHNTDAHLQTLCLNTHHRRVAGASRTQPSTQLSSSDEVTWACCSSWNLYACSSLHTMPLNYCSLGVCKWGGNSQVKGVGEGERGRELIQHCLDAIVMAKIMVSFLFFFNMHLHWLLRKLHGWSKTR